ncbi:MAG: hypothetical protein GJU72_07470 [Acidithiobacillus ferriphilus]|uniref:hypothetical protein n=1 Tax=Acidithiobacillus ferriphilus TaxID=1689834 RepID=UPI00242A77B4|nr:hypothetical protein [Acidithiobacillus ferriphilus]MBW9248896.1 hypothetical protein [Acidithiobacillus ferriphilus]MBW9254883.1 hypothetical protein [Acidithiobacillus ferriphilus]
MAGQVVVGKLRRVAAGRYRVTSRPQGGAASDFGRREFVGKAGWRVIGDLGFPKIGENCVSR